MCSRSLFLSNRRKTWQGMETGKRQPYPRREPQKGMGAGKRLPYPRREPQKGMGAGKHLSYPRRELRKGTGARNLPLYPERKREELNVENADGLKKSCRPADNAVYWYRREW